MSQVNQTSDYKQVLVPMNGDLGHGGLNPPDYSPGPDRMTTGWAPGYYNQAMVNTLPAVTHQSANNSTHSNNVVVIHPGNSTTHTVIVEPPAKNYTALSVFTFLICLPIGLCALFYARDAQSMWLHGHTKEAQNKSRISRNLNIVGIVIGVSVLPTLACHNKVSVNPTLACHHIGECAPNSGCHNRVSVNPTLACHNKGECAPNSGCHNKVSVNPTLACHNKINLSSGIAITEQPVICQPYHRSACHLSTISQINLSSVNAITDQLVICQRYHISTCHLSTISQINLSSVNAITDQPVICQRYHRSTCHLSTLSKINLSSVNAATDQRVNLFLGFHSSPGIIYHSAFPSEYNKEDTLKTDISYN
ncbi:hypothetical protein Btru_070618 [Bulinus truncatus]|nr:hypothetical protein Btru_070618 [Bulinus truncatus]